MEAAMCILKTPPDTATFPEPKQSPIPTALFPSQKILYSPELILISKFPFTAPIAAPFLECGNFSEKISIEGNEYVYNASAFRDETFVSVYLPDFSCELFGELQTETLRKASCFHRRQYLFNRPGHGL